jgi:hypothetical protein
MTLNNDSFERKRLNNETTLENAPSKRVNFTFKNKID